MEMHYSCPKCHYLVEPERGELNTGMKPGTEWEDYPDDWVCPICATPKDQFVPIEAPEW